VALDSKRPRSEQVREIAKQQAALSRKGGIFLTNQDRIKLSHAHIKNIRKANKLAAKEARKMTNKKTEVK